LGSEQSFLRPSNGSGSEFSLGAIMLV
jgi:hypothetical protein